MATARANVPIAVPVSGEICDSTIAELRDRRGSIAQGVALSFETLEGYWGTSGGRSYLVGVDEFTAFRQSAERLLEIADQLTLPERERVRFAVQDRHGDWQRSVRATPAWSAAERLVGLLGAADTELAPERAHELEELVLARLPSLPRT